VSKNSAIVPAWQRDTPSRPCKQPPSFTLEVDSCSREKSSCRHGINEHQGLKWRVLGCPSKKDSYRDGINGHQGLEWRVLGCPSKTDSCRHAATASL
jgi:hypothetical protein